MSYSSVCMGISSSRATGDSIRAGASGCSASTTGTPGSARLPRLPAFSALAASLAARSASLSDRRSARIAARSNATCRRTTRHWCQRTCRFCRNRSGPAIHSAAVAIEKVEIRYTDRIRQIAVSNTDPVRFSHFMSKSASKSPRTPPAENVPPNGCHSGPIESAVHMLRNSSNEPRIFTPGDRISSERTQRQASIQSRMGMLSAAKPNN